jgi:hypothetical protein
VLHAYFVGGPGGVRSKIVQRPYGWQIAARKSGGGVTCEKAWAKLQPPKIFFGRGCLHHILGPAPPGVGLLQTRPGGHLRDWLR